MSIINEKGEISRGFEILLRQILKMLNFDPELILAQINAIHGGLIRHVAQQDQIITQNAEIIQRLERIENGKAVSLGDGREQHAAPNHDDLGGNEQPQ